MVDEVQGSREGQATANCAEELETLQDAATQAMSTYKDAVIRDLKMTRHTVRKLETHVEILKATRGTDVWEDPSSYLQAVQEEVAFQTMKSARKIPTNDFAQSGFIETDLGLRSDLITLRNVPDLPEQQSSVLERFRASNLTCLDSFIQYERDMAELKHYRKSVPELTKRFHQSVLANEHMEQALEENELEVSRLLELKREVTKDLAMADARGLVWQSEIRELEESLEAHMGLANIGGHALGGVINFWVRHAYESDLLWRGIW